MIAGPSNKGLCELGRFVIHTLSVERAINRDCFWLTEEQFAKIEPHLPTDTRGKPRVDDRRVISGIIHVLKSGGRWVDAPRLYGPHKTLYNRFVRWAAKGVGSISSMRSRTQAGHQRRCSSTVRR